VNLAPFARHIKGGTPNGTGNSSALIRSKLADGGLPQNSIPRVWGGAGNGETCDACEETITTVQFVMEGVSTMPELWDAERRAPGRA
jgi:hypothetical protein